MSEQLDIEQVKRDVATRANEIIGQAVEFAREKPHAAVGIAFGIGWVLGNGLPPRVIGTVARIGWRALLGGAVASGGLASMLGGIMGQGEDAGTEGGSRQAVRSGAPRSSGTRSGEGSSSGGTSGGGSSSRSRGGASSSSASSKE